MKAVTKVAEEELVRAPAWRVRRGEERRDIRSCVIANAKLHAGPKPSTGIDLR
jgi:hypothetical protein